MQFAMQGGLGRPESLEIRRITFDFRQHPGRDGGTRSNGAQVLALEKARFSHALLVLDHEGSGDVFPWMESNDGGLLARFPPLNRLGSRESFDDLQFHLPPRAACFHARFALEAAVR